MLFEWQDILQLKPKRFFDSVYFFHYSLQDKAAAWLIV